MLVPSSPSQTPLVSGEERESERETEGLEGGCPSHGLSNKSLAQILSSSLSVYVPGIHVWDTLQKEMNLSSQFLSLLLLFLSWEESKYFHQKLKNDF